MSWGDDADHGPLPVFFLCVQREPEPVPVFLWRWPRRTGFTWWSWFAVIHDIRVPRQRSVANVMVDGSPKEKMPTTVGNPISTNFAKRVDGNFCNAPWSFPN
ncbi:MAG: hypothetical protein GY762_17015 [Proteobacteria bacterium]|nr:hypothetical protein [Pseudomonadota bacterium]